MNWAIAKLFVNIDKIILEERFGNDVELMARVAMPTFNSMKDENGSEIATELWVNDFIRRLSFF